MRRLSILIAILLSASVARAALESPTAVTTAEPLARFPATLSDWRSTDSPLASDVVAMAAVDDYLNRYYNSEAGELALYVGYYQSQAQGEALHSPLFCLPGAGWQPVTVRRTDLRGSA